MHIQIRPTKASACNDNGFAAICGAAAKPHDVLTAARSACGEIALLYVARGSTLLTSAPPQARVSAAA